MGNRYLPNLGTKGNDDLSKAISKTSNDYMQLRRRAHISQKSQILNDATGGGNTFA